jgi:hypothetical protein
MQFVVLANMAYPCHYILKRRQADLAERLLVHRSVRVVAQVLGVVALECFTVELTPFFCMPSMQPTATAKAKNGSSLPSKEDTDVCVSEGNGLNSGLCRPWNLSVDDTRNPGRNKRSKGGEADEASPPLQLSRVITENPL